jgi:hypothetical protein
MSKHRDLILAILVGHANLVDHVGIPVVTLAILVDHVGILEDLALIDVEDNKAKKPWGILKC